MKDERPYRSYGGAVLNRRLVNGLNLAEAVYAPGLELPPHAHRHGGFCLILRGSYVESYGRTLLECHPAQVKFHPAGEPHSDVYGGAGVRSFIVELPSEWLGRVGGGDLLGKSPLVYRNSSLSWLMMRLRAELHSADEESPFVVEGLALELLAGASRSRRRSPPNAPPPWLRQVKELLDEQFAHPPPLSLIAKSAGVHPVHLAHSFRRHYQRSVGEYLRQRRIEFACRRLSASGEPLAEIALAAGFSNQSHFTRTFRRVTGTTPARYRALCRPS